MFGALDNFFCDLEGKPLATQPHNKQPRTIKKHLQSKPHKNINTLGSALYHLYVSGSLENKGLEGWKDDKEKFKVDLLNDLKTFLFGKWEKPWNPGLIFNDKGEIISGFRNIHGRVFKEGGNVIGLEANKGTSPFFITKPAIEKQKGEVNNKQKWVGILSYIPIADEADPKKVKFMLPKFHNVINVDFVDGIKKPVYKTIEFKDLELNEYVENFIKELVKRKRIPTLHYDQADRAYYTHSLLSWTGDSIHLPLIKQFKNIEAFYSTLFHEITHSTMNPDRCGRGKGALSFKTELPYANEELVAEMGSMIICSELGLQYNRQNSLTYLKSWLAKAGKDSDTAMIEAYAYACDAADYLMKDIDFSKLVPASMQKRAEKESPDSPPTVPGTPRKTGVRAKVTKHSKVKGKKSTKREKKQVKAVKSEAPAKEETPFEALNRVVKTIKKNKPQPADNQHTTKTTKTTFGTTKKKNIKAPKQDRLTNPIDIFIFKAGNTFRGIPQEQIKALLTALERLKKEKKDCTEYEETGDLMWMGWTYEEIEVLGIDPDHNNEPQTDLLTSKGHYFYKLRLSELGEKIFEAFKKFKANKANLKPVNTGQLSLFGVKNSYSNDIKQFFAGNFKGNIIEITTPKAFLLKNGFPNHPIAIRPKTLKEKIKKHDLNYQDHFKHLPTWLNSPLMLFKSETVPGAFNIITERENKEGLLCCSIHPDTKINKMVVSEIASLHGRNINQLTRWTENDSLIIAQIEKTEKIFSDSGFNSPKSKHLIGLIKAKLKQNSENGKKNTLGEIDTPPQVPQMPTIESEKTHIAPTIVPRMPRMPQMPRAKTEMSPVFIPKEPTDNMAELGFINDFNALQKGETFRLPGALGEFLGEYDRQCYSIALRGEKGAGKSRLVYQLMNAFASQGLNVAFLTLEMSYNSSISIGYRDEYIDPENIARIKPTEKAMTFDELNKVCKQFDVLVIDSWTKLKGMNQTDFDRLQKLNPRTIIVAIFQSTTGGVSRGGNMPEYDAGTVIQVNKGGFAECEKNRYAPCDKIFSVFDKMLIAPEAMEAV